MCLRWGICADVFLLWASSSQDSNSQRIPYLTFRSMDGNAPQSGVFAPRRALDGLHLDQRGGAPCQGPWRWPYAEGLGCVWSVW